MLSLDSAALVLFWTSVVILLYVAVFYPGAVALLARVRPRPHTREPILPPLTVVMAAHNEVTRIGQKISNLLELDYPADRVEVLVGSDGSTDGTVERLRQVSAQRIRIFVFEERQGKPKVLNKLIPNASAEIVVLADVRQRFDPQVLRNLVQPFADPQVGAVSGELIFTTESDCTTVGEGAGAYWKYEKFIRSRESRFDSTVGATGAIYAIRKSLFEPIPEDTILDDVLIPLRIVRRGFRVLFEPSARACDLPSETALQEFTRKVRTLAGNFQLFARERWLLNPARNRIWWQTLSHKFLRLFLPLLQMFALLSNTVLTPASPFFQVALLLQLFFYAGAAAGWLLQRSGRKFAPATFPYTFCLLSWATVVGFLRYVTRSQAVTWEKTATSELPSLR